MKEKPFKLTHPHGVWVLVGEEGEEGGEAAEPGREEDEEGQLLLRVHGHLVERRQQLSVRAFYTFIVNKNILDNETN